jgi:hypothetical protein
MHMLFPRESDFISSHCYFPLLTNLFEPNYNNLEGQVLDETYRGI